MLHGSCKNEKMEPSTEEVPVVWKVEDCKMPCTDDLPLLPLMYLLYFYCRRSIPLEEDGAMHSLAFERVDAI